MWPSRSKSCWTVCGGWAPEQALEKLRLDDITPAEIDRIWTHLDVDGSNDVDYREFVRKLERYGLRNVGKEENILY